MKLLKILLFINFISLNVIAEEKLILDDFNCSISILDNWTKEENLIEQLKLVLRSKDEKVVLSLIIAEADPKIKADEFLERYKNRILTNKKSTEIIEQKIKVQDSSGYLLNHKQKLQNLDIHKLQKITIANKFLYHIDASGIGVDPSSYPDVKLFFDSFKLTKVYKEATPKPEPEKVYGTPELLADITTALLVVVAIIVIIRKTKKKGDD